MPDFKSILGNNITLSDKKCRFLILLSHVIDAKIGRWNFGTERIFEKYFHYIFSKTYHLTEVLTYY